MLIVNEKIFIGSGKLACTTQACIKRTTPKNLEQFFKKSFKSLPCPYRCRELERKHKDPLLMLHNPSWVAEK